MATRLQMTKGAMVKAGMMNKDYEDLRKAWAESAKQLRTPEECTAATVKAMESKADDKQNANGTQDNTGKALAALLKLAPQKRQVVYCLGCRYAILPNDPIEVTELAMTGCIHCHKRSALYGGCNPCGQFQRRKAYLSDIDYHLMRDRVII